VLEQWPFTRDAVPATNAEVVRWWESRRFAYNGIVALAGIAAIAVLAINAIMRDDSCGVPDPPIFGLLAIIAYGAMANVCYTFGSVTEILARRRMTREAASERAQAWFVAGVMFSVLLTVAPAVLIPVACMGHSTDYDIQP
jgi:hypothetical protein